MQHLEVSGAVRPIYIYIYVIRRLKVNLVMSSNDFTVSVLRMSRYNYYTTLSHYMKVKGERSVYRPEQAAMVTGGRGSQISRRRHIKVVKLSVLRTGRPLPTRKYSWY